jgi:hypothetical protein
MDIYFLLYEGQVHHNAIEYSNDTVCSILAHKVQMLLPDHSFRNPSQ